MGEQARLAWAGAFVCRDGRFVAVRNAREDTDWWSLPAGGVERGETLRRRLP